MQNPLTSRSIVSDKIYKKFSQTAYDIHKQKLKEIYTKENIKRQIENQEESKINLMRLTRNRKAYESCHQKIDLKVKLQNKSLCRNLAQIISRRSQSEINLKLQKSHLIENQKKQVKKENKIMFEKIITFSKLEIKDIKRNLLKQFKEYEDKKNMIRRLKEPASPKDRASLTARKSKSSARLLKLETKQESLLDQ